MGEELYNQSMSLLYNPEKASIPIAHCAYALNINCVDLLCGDAVGVPHRHNSNFEIYYVLEGELDIDIDGDRVRLNENDCLCLAPGIMHHTLYNPQAKNQYFIIVFNLQRSRSGRASGKPPELDTTKKLADFMRFIIDRGYCRVADRQDLSKYVKAMSSEVWKGESGWKTMLYSYYVMLIFGVMRNLFEDSEIEQNYVSENLAVRINKYLSKHYNEKLTLQHIADTMFYSTRHINRILNRYFNSSFTKTLSRYRVNYAKNYLVESDYSIEKIAYLVGYSSSNTLFKLFKEMEGMTPGEYRQMYKVDKV